MLGKPEKQAQEVPGKPEQKHHRCLANLRKKHHRCLGSLRKKHHRYLVDLYTKTTGALQTCTTHMEGGGGPRLLAVNWFVP